MIAKSPKIGFTREKEVSALAYFLSPLKKTWQYLAVISGKYNGQAIVFGELNINLIRERNYLDFKIT